VGDGTFTTDGGPEMKRALVGITVSAMVLFGGGVAFGGEAPAADPEVRVFNFEGDVISTDYLKPGAFMVEALRRGRRSSLIDVRLDFVAEILRSAEDI